MIDKSGFHFTYDGENSKSHKLVVTGVDDYALPQKKVITYDIDGRDGSLLYDTKAFENRLVKIQVKLIANSKEEFNAYAEDIVRWLQDDVDFKPLILSDNPNYYFLASCINKIAISRTLITVGTATLVFECKPYKFYCIGDEPRELSEGKTLIVNPSPYISHPLIKFVGNASFIIKVGDQDPVQFEGLVGTENYPVILDTDLMDAYRHLESGSVKNLNRFMVSGYWEDLWLPKDSADVEIIKVNGTIKSITMDARWRKL